MEYNSEMVQSNIQEIFDQHTLEDFKGGSRWYRDANGFSISLANQYNTEPYKVAGIISALSPMKSWDLNKQIAEKALKRRTMRGLHWYNQTGKAKRIKQCSDVSQVDDILGGLKTINFFHNIYEPDNQDYLTVDRWMSVIALGVRKQKFTPKQYNFLKGEYKKFAMKVGMDPVPLQATLWVVAHRTKKEI